MPRDHGKTALLRRMRAHDWLNSHYWYNEAGNGINHQGFSRIFGEILNGLNVIIATPIVAASVIPPITYGAFLK